jgi:mannose-6-phosphate isomerase-like protein (cupin superfamily)
MSDHLKEWSRWMRVGPRVERNLVIDAEGLHLVRFKVAPGTTVGFHRHDLAQITVILSGTGVHRFTVDLHGKGRKRRVTTALRVGPGDCYYIPAGTPHSFDSDRSAPVVCLDIMVRSGDTRLPARPTRQAPARARSKQLVRPGRRNG